MMGITGDHVPKFVKQYAQVSEIMDEAAARYAAEVRSREFPATEQTYQVKKTAQK
jgi:3-methyl-2-oxobutanoate hydroxymethyltransferase